MVDNSIVNPPEALTYSGGFRVTPFPTVYGDLKTSWQFDMELMGILAAWLMVTFALLVILPTIRPRKSECLPFWFSFFYLWVGGLLMLSIYGHGWQQAFLQTRTFYISNSNLYIDAQVGLHVGLRGINVTLLGTPKIQANHTIDYNERFWWGGEDVALPTVSWGQGKDTFGANGGQYNQEYKRQLEKGVPWPVLWVAEWFTVDAEYIRWGRYYRWAGYYSFQLLWTAFCVWLLNLFIFMMSPIWGFIGLTLVGAMMVVTITIYGGLIQTVNSRIGVLTIPFESGNLVPIYSWSFFFVLFTGVAAILAGVAGMITLTATKKEEEITFVDGPNSVEMKEKPAPVSPSNNNNNGWQQQGQPQYAYGQNQGQPQYNYNAMEPQQPYVPPRPKGVNEVQFHH